MSMLPTQLLLGRAETGDTINRETWLAATRAVFPPVFHHYAEKGLYVFRFFKDGRWRYVMVDDMIPCDKTKGGAPVFSWAGDECLFVPLIEKAYAKLHGCYFGITGGNILEAVTDLTGLYPVKVGVEAKDDMRLTEAQKDDLWGYVVELKGKATGFKATGAMDQQVKLHDADTGVRTGRIYPLVDVFELKKATGKGRSRLLRVRRIAGGQDWKGKWGETSQKYLDCKNQQVKAGPAGTFLMCFKDWRNIFDSVYVCDKLPSEHVGGTWEFPVKSGESNDLDQQTADPAYYVSLEVAEFGPDLFVSLVQEDPRLKTSVISSTMRQIGVTVLHLAGGKGKSMANYCFSVDGKKATIGSGKVVYTCNEMTTRQVTVQTCMQIAGTYVVVPTVKGPGQDGRLWLSVWALTSAASGITFTHPAARRIEIE